MALNARPVAFLQATLGIGALCVLDAIVKHLTGSNPVLVVVTGRYAAGTALALIVWVVAGRPAFTREMLPAHLGRGLIIAAMAAAFYYGLTVLPLAETITLSFIAPLLVPPIARATLGEPMQPRYLAAGLLGFAGVLVTTQGAPDFSGDRLLALAAVLFSAVAYAGNIVIMRARAARDGSTIVTLMGALVPLFFLAPFIIGAPLPDPASLGWIAAMGLVGNIGIQLLSRAYARVEAQALAVLEFSALPWAALFGWLVFAEPVRWQVWLGAAIICTACLWAARGERAVVGVEG